jgi:hypothetical protein
LVLLLRLVECRLRLRDQVLAMDALFLLGRFIGAPL